MQIKNIAIVASFSLILSVASCTGGGGDSSDDPGSGNSSLILNRQSLNATADSSGRASFSFSLPAATASFQLAVNAGSISGLSGVGGDLLKQASLVSTQQKGSTTNVPYFSSAAILGQNFNAAYSAPAGTSVSLQIHSKGDAVRTSGTLKLNIVLLGPVGGSEDVLSALDTALEVARITFSRAGITLDTQISNFDGPGIAPAPGDSLYQGILAAQRPASITVVLASERKGRKTDDQQYGTTGATPFPVSANADSVVLIGLQDITGTDGIFDDSEHNDERRLLGEEIGRFTARALGLPNIVSIKGSKVSGSDDLADTAGCITEDSCREDPAARTNLMYPEPLEKRDQDQVESSREFYPRDQLTAQQGQVLNNSVFID